MPKNLLTLQWRNPVFHQQYSLNNQIRRTMNTNWSLVTLSLCGALSIAAPQPTHAEPHVPVVQTTAETLRFTVANPGELAQTILDQGLTWTDIQDIAVTGELNDTDLGVFKRFTNLTKMDLSGANFDKLPDSFVKSTLLKLREVKLPVLESIGNFAFYECSALSDVEIAGVKVIMNYAFANTNLQTINLPSQMEEIHNNTFEQTKLTSIAIPEGIRTIPSCCFKYCNQLTTVTLPSTIETIENEAFAYSGLTAVNLSGVAHIGYGAFSGCRALAQVTFDDFLVELGGDAFNQCVSLTKVELPPYLRSISQSFSGCTNLKKVTSKAVTPPWAAGCPLGQEDMTHVKLYVSAISVGTYRNKNGWKDFYSIYPLDEPVSQIMVNTPMTLEDGTQVADDAEIILNWQDTGPYFPGQVGELTYNGTTPLNLGTFVHSHYLKNMRSSYIASDLGFDEHTILKANGPMTAKEVVNLFTPSYSSKWYFVSFPNDVQFSDISNDQGAVFVIRRYNSTNRGFQAGNTWENVSKGDKLNAYEGYILRTRGEQAEFLFPSMDNEKKNNLFASGDVTLPLKEYYSAKDQHRSWNFIGNPYPCYYPIEKTDYTAPITVYNQSQERYEAYSPLDDIYILHPGEAFFVQKPSTLNAIRFSAEGRMNLIEAMEYVGSGALRSTRKGSRQLFNLQLTDGEHTDHTRFVINEQASLHYEMDKDASKFQENESNVPLIFTIADSVRYAINERPLSDGKIAVGYYAPEKGRYTLRLSRPSTQNTWLIDRNTGKTQPLDEGYTFETEPGYHDDRFTVTLGDAVANETIDAEKPQIEVGLGQVRVSEAYTLYTPLGQYIGQYAAGETAYVKADTYLVVSQHIHQLIVVKS